MSKFNTRSARPAAGRGPVAAQPTPSGRTHEGGAGYAHDAKSELFLLAVANFVGENTFSDKATDRDRRLTLAETSAHCFHECTYLNIMGIVR